VNEQLVAMGRRTISGFHHEAGSLPDGRIVALADVEQILTDVQGPGPVDVVGDMIIVFDSDLKVLWTWDTFDHLDVTRLATGGEICTVTMNGCPPTYLAAQVNDWTHGNAVQLTPDGNLLYSARHQDWLIKINYANGAGDGSILWRLGKGGDFTFLSDDPYPWFSHQHDGNFELSDPARLAVFDNGNLRLVNANGPVHSRGQVLELDEAARTAKLVLNADLGVLSIAVGTAEPLSDGTYHFDAGAVLDPNGVAAYSVEVDACGQAASTLHANTLLYRSFRMSDLYTPPEMRKGVRGRPPRYTADSHGGC
jgi:arylsulfate sulfotransferase